MKKYHKTIVYKSNVFLKTEDNFCLGHQISFELSALVSADG